MSQELQSGPTVGEDDLARMEVEGTAFGVANNIEEEEEEEGEDELGDDADEEDDEDDEGSDLEGPSGQGGSLLDRMQRQNDNTQEDLTASALLALQQTEDKVVSLLEIAAQTASELARVEPGDEARERLRGHIDAFFSTTQDIHQTLREQIKLVPPALPFEGHSYNSKMDFEIAKMQTQAVRAHLDHLQEYIEQLQRPPA